MTTQPRPTLAPLLLSSTISPPSGTTTSHIHSTTAIFIVVLITAFFFVTFFVIYVRNNYLFHSPRGPARVITQDSTRGSGHHNGLEASTLETLPTFVYSEVKGRKIGKETLECAICLSEFSDDEVLRLLPSCSHVYHVDCIDIWLETHVTCPICRTNLAAADFGGSASVEHLEIVVQNDGGPEEAVVAPVEGVKEVVGPETLAVRFSRWHTIGHSAAPVWDCYTLRLPEHVRGEIMAAGKLRREESTAAREVSGRRGFRVSQSERWAPSFLARALSIKLPAWSAAVRGRIGEGEGVIQTAGASFGCIGGGGGGGEGRMESGEEDSEASTVALARVRPSADEV